MSPLEVYLVTFNCARALVDPAAFASSFFDALLPNAAFPDIIAVSLQEVAPIAHSFLGDTYVQPYFNQIDAAVHLAISQHSSEARTFETLFTGNNGMTALMLFASRDVTERITKLSSATTGVGLFDMGNKGAVGAKLSLKGDRAGSNVDFIFVAAHLAPMEIAWERRNEDFITIARTLVFGDSSTTRLARTSDTDSAEDDRQELMPGSSVETGIYDGAYVFFCGDLNYRTSDAPPNEDSHLAYPQPAESEDSPLHFAHLLKKDQLTRERRAEHTLHGFEELPISFRPTYKINHKIKHLSNGAASEAKEIWRWAKHRFPSWCDRCLVLVPGRTAPSPEYHKYTSLNLQATSDHQPVALCLAIPAAAWEQDHARDSSMRPFSVDPNWRARQLAGRRKEYAVGVLAYLTTTAEGLTASLIGVASLAILTYIITSRI